MLHLIYLERALLLSKKPYSDWREIQAEYFDYKTSLSFGGVEEVLGFLKDEYPEYQTPELEARIRAFTGSSEAAMSL